MRSIEAARKAEQRLRPPPQKPHPMGEEKVTEPKLPDLDETYFINCSVACHTYAGIADEGDSNGFIRDIVRSGGAEPNLLVSFPLGEDWFSLDQFDNYFYTTGKSVVPDDI